MIPRYSRPKMSAIWEPESRFRIFLEIETHALDAMVELGLAPKSAAEALRKRGGFDIERIDAIEAEVKHDFIAFLTNLGEHVGDEARFIHQGMTSSDVLDTCLSVQLARATDILLEDIDRLLEILKRRAFEHKTTLCMGRSHGIHGEPTSFGLKLAQAYAEFSRHRERLLAAREEIAVCAISGAMGNFAHLDPRIEAHVAKQMGLSVESISTQVIARDRHAVYFALLGVAASSVERLAVEIRHLQRSEVGEAEEYFSGGQKGSSAMPHKRNPVASENLTGLARLVRSMVAPAMENVALWHERDISHSSVERVIAPDATIALDFALARLGDVLDGLVVYPEKMAQNMECLGGLVYSQRVLLALVGKGMSREDAYRLVQGHAMAVWESGGNLLERLQGDKKVTKLIGDELDSLFDPNWFARRVDVLFERVFGK
ncbi:MAG: adenylosuccinate lyase [Hyphomicrobiales bacterium]|nr:adenylosuccinate lyase [Hyphomicrobiales bacterium]MCY4038038.1 adenylosuccinate lyase [Hyphomicrobiales bacterium]